MDWTIILCLVFANVFSSNGGDLRRRFSLGDFSRVSSRDYFTFGDSKHISATLSSEKNSPGHTLLRSFKYPQADRKKQRIHYRKSSDLPNLLRSYLEHRLSKVADKRRSTLTQHSEEVQESVLPPSEPARPGHNLLQPTKTMLQSAAKFPRTDGISLVYGSQDNLGIVHGKTPSRVLYSDFRKDNLANLIMNILKNPNSAQDLRRSSTAKKKVTDKKKTLKLKNKNDKKGQQFKQLDTKRHEIYHSDFDSSNEIHNNNKDASKAKPLKKNKKVENHNSSNALKETKTRAFQSSGSFGSYKKKRNTKFNKNNKKHLKPEKQVNIHGKIVDKLNEQLDQKLKSSKLKKMVPINEYKKKMTNKKKSLPLLIRQSDNYEVSPIKSHNRGKSPKYGHRKDSSSSEDSSSREDKKSKIIMKKFSKGSQKKQMFRQRESDGSSEKENQKNDDNYKESGEKKSKNNKGEESKDKNKKNPARLVYGSPDNYGIVWAKTPYRTMYTDFRRTTSLLGKILETYHSYKKKQNLKRALVAIKVWPLEKTKMHNQVLDSNSNEILDDDSIEIDVKVTNYRKQRRKSKVKIKSAFRNRDENYDNKNSTECAKSEDEESDDSDYEKNPGNPYTLFKNKYRQNWPWHFELGDHMNLNQFGPQFDNQGGPSGADLFFNRKWWYFNQDDYIPFR